MASLAQMTANRANAQKSTGPRSDEGKETTRRNALKHGLAGRMALLPDEEGGLVAARIEAWTAVFTPRDAYEVWLVEQVAVSSVQIEHCQAHENSLRTRQATRAALCWDVDRESEAEDLGVLLAKSPAKVAHKLRRTKQGCAWLIGRWEGLARILEAKGDWDEPQKRLALDLLATPVELRDGWTLLDGDRPALIREQLGRLRSLSETALVELDDQERADAEMGFGPDFDKALALARRYEAACVRRLESARTQLKKNRQAARPDRPAPKRDAAASGLATEQAERERLIRALAESAGPDRVANFAATPTATAHENRHDRRARRARDRRS